VHKTSISTGYFVFRAVLLGLLNYADKSGTSIAGSLGISELALIIFAGDFGGQADFATGDALMRTALNRRARRRCYVVKLLFVCASGAWSATRRCS
jgi:hypothetical protein